MTLNYYSYFSGRESTRTVPELVPVATHHQGPDYCRPNLGRIGHPWCEISKISVLYIPGTSSATSTTNLTFCGRWAGSTEDFRSVAYSLFRPFRDRRHYHL
jgi:hypothetical protein